MTVNQPTPFLINLPFQQHTHHKPFTMRGGVCLSAWNLYQGCEMVIHEGNLDRAASHCIVTGLVSASS